MASWIFPVTVGTGSTANQYVITKVGEHFLGLQATFNSNGNVLRLHTNITVKPVSFELKVALLTENRIRVLVRTAKLQRGSRVHFHLGVQDSRNRSVYVPKNANLWWSLKSELCSEEGTESGSRVTVNEGPVFGDIFVQMPWSTGVAFVYHKARLHVRGAPGQTGPQIIRQKFILIDRENVFTDNTSNGRLQLVIRTSDGDRNGVKSRIKSNAVSIFEKQYPNLTICGMTMIRTTWKTEIQMDVIASDHAKLMMSIHRLKESVRWNEFFLSLMDKHFEPTYMSFISGKKKLSMDLGSTDETVYENVDAGNERNYQLQVSSHLINHESVSPVKTNEMEVASNVDFKIRVIRGSDRLVKIPRNAVFWWTLESELCSTKMTRQRTVINFREGNVYRTMRSQMPTEPGIVFVYHRGTLHTNNDAHDLPLHKQLFRVGAMSVKQRDEDLIELVRFVIPTSRKVSLTGKEERIRAALRSSIEDVNVGVKLCGLEVNTDQPNVRVQMHMIGSSVGELEIAVQRLRDEIDQKLFKIVIEKISYSILRHSFQAMNAINRMPRFFNQPTSKPIGNKIKVHTRERETITGIIVDFVVEVRDEWDHCVQIKENDAQWWQLETEVCSTELVRQESSIMLKQGCVRHEIPVDKLSGSSVAFAYYRAALHNKRFGMVSVEEISMERRELIIDDVGRMSVDRNSFGHVQFSILVDNESDKTEDWRMRTIIRDLVASQFPTILICGLEVSENRGKFTFQMDVFSTSVDELADVLRRWTQSISDKMFAVPLNGKRVHVVHDSFRVIYGDEIADAKFIAISDMSTNGLPGRGQHTEILV